MEIYCLSNVVASSMELHAPYGGVVPEIAARSHIEAIIPTISTALDQAKTNWPDIDAIAVTYGAGLRRQFIGWRFNGQDFGNYLQ